ncbi:MAG: hypothetical protein ACRENY_04315 [Candidatus Dormibacteria bacterium]
MFARGLRQQGAAIAGRRRVVQRSRHSLALLLKAVVVTLLVGAVMTQVVLGTAGSKGPSVVVRPGQTLWGIVSSHYPQTDPRDAIQAVESANHLRGAALSPGERLLLPPA